MFYWRDRRENSTQNAILAQEIVTLDKEFLFKILIHKSRYNDKYYCAVSIEIFQLRDFLRD